MEHSFTVSEGKGGNGMDLFMRGPRQGSLLMVGPENRVCLCAVGALSWGTVSGFY